MWHLVGDIGGTNMRLSAMSVAGDVLASMTRPTRDTQNFHAALVDLKSEIGSAPAKAVVAAAGIVHEGAVILTNARACAIADANMDKVLGIEGSRVINDFEAAAWSLASLTSTDVTALQGQSDFAPAPRLIIGPGTGLGVGALVWAKGVPCIVPGEGGHVRLSPAIDWEVEVFRALIADWPEIQMGDGLAVEAEGILSGTALPYLSKAVAQALGVPAFSGSAQDLFAAAKAGSDPSAVATIGMFSRHLGALAGDLGLAFGAKGGVFLAGGVAASNPWIFDSTFIEAFNAGGRHRTWRETMPLYLCTSGDFGLRGARNAILWG